MMYNLLFYRIYKFVIRTSGPKYHRLVIAISVAAFISGQIAVNILVISLLIERYTSLTLTILKKYIIFPSLVFNYVYFLWQNKYQEIEIQYANESEKHKIISSILTIAYLIITIGSIVLVGIYL